MIVQCEQCQTKYRIADDKVTGKGVKVRCAKCENVFTVKPPEKNIQDSPPDFRPAAPTPAEPPSGGELQPGMDRGMEPQASEPQEDDGTERLAEPPIPTAIPPAEGAQGLPVPEEKPEQFENEIPPDEGPGSYLPPSPEERAPGHGSSRPEHEMDQTLSGEGAPPLGSQTLPEDDGFEIEATMREETPSEPDPISGSSMESPAGTGPMADEEWGNISIDASSDTGSPEDVFGLADSPGYEPPPSPPTEDSLDQELPSPLPPPTQSQNGTTAFSSPPETAKSGGGKKGLFVVLLLAVLGAGGYFAYPTIMEVIKSRTQQPAGTLTPANIEVKALSRNDGKVIYSVRGEVRNDSGDNVGMIKVEAQFRDASGAVLTQAAAYCGNILGDNELVQTDLARIRKDLMNELGQSLSNSNILPGKTIPFLIVLENPPAGVDKVTVTISSFKKTS